MRGEPGSFMLPATGLSTEYQVLSHLYSAILAHVPCTNFQHQQPEADEAEKKEANHDAAPWICAGVAELRGRSEGVIQAPYAQAQDNQRDDVSAGIGGFRI